MVDVKGTFPSPVKWSKRRPAPARTAIDRTLFGTAAAILGHFTSLAGQPAGERVLVVARARPDPGAAAWRSGGLLTWKNGGHLAPDPSTRVPRVGSDMRILPTRTRAVVMQNA